jgi:hypothetical protein
VIVSCVGIAYYNVLRDQLFVSTIDALMVTMFTIIFLIWETQKEANYFDDVDQSKMEVAHDSGFFDNRLNKSGAVGGGNDDSLLLKDT